MLKTHIIPDYSYLASIQSYSPSKWVYFACFCPFLSIFSLLWNYNSILYSVFKILAAVHSRMLHPKSLCFHKLNDLFENSDRCFQSAFVEFLKSVQKVCGHRYNILTSLRYPVIVFYTISRWKDNSMQFIIKVFCTLRGQQKIFRFLVRFNLRISIKLKEQKNSFGAREKRVSS